MRLAGRSGYPLLLAVAIGACGGDDVSEPSIERDAGSDATIERDATSNEADAARTDANERDTGGESANDAAGEGATEARDEVDAADDRIDASLDASGLDAAETGLSHDAAPGDGGPCVMSAPAIPAMRFVPVTSSALGFATFAMQPPDSDDWYVVDQRGSVVVVRGGTAVGVPFLDITKAIGTNLGERGLLSIAFHPNYRENGRFFTMGTPAADGDGTYAPANADAVVEWKRDPFDPGLALPTKVRDIVVLPASADNHNGGAIQFGPDNYLYVGTGDGGGGCESAEPGAVQDPSKLFGKILRLDVDAAPPFAAPGNPFADDPRVYHYGLRNPFRWNFDRVTHDLFIGDVGQSAYEEISVAPGNVPGQNFGWPAYEGEIPGTCGVRPLGGPSPYRAPIVSIDRKLGSQSPLADYQSIVGGVVYRGSAIPSLQGVYVFADFYGAELAALRYCNGQVYGPSTSALVAIASGDAGAVYGVTQLVEGHDRELYVMYGLYLGAHFGKLAPP